MTITPMPSSPSTPFSTFLRSRTSVAIQIALLVVGIFIFRRWSLWLPVPVAVIAALLIWLSSDSWRGLGFGRPALAASRWIVEGVMAGLLWGIVAARLLTPLLNFLLRAESAPPAHKGEVSYLLTSIILFGIVHALAKGLAYRAFLLNRLEALLGQTRTGIGLAVAAAAIWFGLGNLSLLFDPGQQTYAGFIIATLAGVVFNLVFYWSKRNVRPSILAHGIYNTTLFALVFLGYL